MQNISDFSTTIKIIVEKYGESILFEGNRFCAMFDDYAPQLKEERKILRQINQEGLITEFGKAKSSRSEAERNKILKQIELKIYNCHYTTDFAWISISSFCNAFSWECPIKQSTRQTLNQPINASKTKKIVQSQPINAPTQPIQTSPQTIPLSQTITPQVQGKKPFRVIAIVVAVLLLIVVGGWMLLSNVGQSDIQSTTAGVTGLVAETEISHTVIDDTYTSKSEESSASQTVIQEASSAAYTPELPDVVGLSYAEAEDRILSVDSAPQLQFQFDENHNRGCILDLSWQENQLVVSISAGRDSGFYCMRKEFADGSIDYVDVYFTDQWGRHTQAYKYDSNGGLIYSFEFEYNDYGQEIGQNFYLPDGSFHHSWIFKYDLYGRLTAEYKYDGNGSELSHSEFSYDSKGKLKEKKDYMNGGLAYVWKMNKYDSDATPLTYYTHMYGNWTDATIADGSGTVIRSGKQSFDSDGNVKSYEIYENTGQLAYQYVFDSAPISEINNLSDKIRDN